MQRIKYTNFRKQNDDNLSFGTLGVRITFFAPSRNNHQREKSQKFDLSRIVFA
jgi:hypothetical protein